MNRWSNWRDGLPLGVFFPVIFVIWTGVRLAVAAGGGDRITTALVAFEVIGGLIFAGILTALLAWRRRRSGGKSEYTAMNTAVRTGQLPEDAEPSLWAPELERRRRSFSRARVANPIVFGFVALLGVVLLISGTTVILSAILIVFFVGFAIYNTIVCVRSLARVESLQRQLDPRGSASVASFEPRQP